MKRIKKTRLIHRVLGCIVPLLAISIILTSLVLCWTSHKYFQKTINQDYGNILKGLASEIRLFMSDAQKNLSGLALIISATKLDQWQKDAALTAFNQTATEFIFVSLVSREGKQIASTRREEDDIRFSETAMFRKVLTGQNASSGVIVTKQDIPYVHMAVPVSHVGEVVEVLWGKLNLKSLWGRLEGITIGKTGHVYIMDSSGRYIGHRNIDRVITALPAEKPDILKELRESDTPVEWMKEEDGIKVYCLASYIPDLDWVIVLSQAYAEVHAHLYQNICWAVLVTFVIGLFATLIGWNRVKCLLAPVHTLGRQVQRIGQGDLDQKVCVDSRDEIGDLALAFNEMTDSLHKHMNREVEAAKELAHAKKLAVLGSASSKVTHEVGNLLTSIGLAIATLKGEALSQKGENALAILEKESGLVRGFIHNFLQFSKKPELHLGKTPLHAIIGEVLFVQRSDAEKRGIRFELNWPSNLPPVNVDARLMHRVVNNLIKNGLEAMSGPGEIRIDGKVEGEHLLITIKDTGPGIEPDVLAQIFDPFFTTKGKRGTGLGLSIVKTIVEAHGGTIECRSELKKGTTFILRLPLR